MSELERILQASAAEIDFPPTPDFTAGLREAPARGRRIAPRPTRTLLLAALGLLLVAGGAVAALTSDDDPRGVTIRVVERLPVISAPGEPVLRPLGTQVSFEEAESLVDFDLLSTPTPPERVYFYDGVPGGAVTLESEDVIVGEFDGSVDRDLVAKLATADTHIERFRIDGDRATWIEGASHAMYLLDRDGRVIEETLRLADNVLLVERGDLLIRIEGDLTREGAVRLVRSLR